MCDFDHELMFPSYLEELGEYFFNKENIDTDDRDQYLFRKSCIHARTSHLSDKKCVRFLILNLLYFYFIKTIIVKKIP